MIERGNYLVGPLARWALSGDRLTPLALEAAKEAGLERDERNPFRTILIRSVELVFAADEALRLIAEYEPPDPPFVEVLPRAGVGYGCSEAPRGICWHRYEIDDDGTILDAKIVPPTSQNQKTIESDLHGVVERYADLPDEELSLRCEQAIRNYDPCISCATHFLKLEVDRGMKVIGVGNEWRQRRRRRAGGRQEVGWHSVSGASRSVWSTPSTATAEVAIVDAVSSGVPPGTLHVFEADARAAARGAVRLLVDPRARHRRCDRDRPLAREVARPRSGHRDRGSTVRLRARTEPRGRGGGGGMHEKHLTEDLVRKLEALAAEEGGSQVTRIRVRLGALSHFTPEHFREHFDDAAAGTLAEGARVEAELDPDPTAPGAQGVVLETVELELEREESP